MNSIRFIGMLRRMNARLYSVPYFENNKKRAALIASLQNQTAKIIENSLRKYNAGDISGAWSSLVNAAAGIGYIQGSFLSFDKDAPKQDIKDLLAAIGAKGGRAKGMNGDQLRDLAAKKLIDAAPNGKWPSKAAFDLNYEKIVQSVPGFSSSDYQRRKIVSRPDIKATLPSGKRQSRK